MPKLPTSELPNLPRRKRGPKPLALADKREHCVSVRLNSVELTDLDSARVLVRMQRGEYLRAASRGVLPPTIPQINREAWSNLARVVGNLNQYQTKINEGLVTSHSPEMIEELRDLVQKLRSDLIGIRESEADDEG
jgi:hypothetical protein